MLQPWKRRILTFFILFTWVGILVGKPYQDTAIGRFYYPYLIWTRLLQQWRLFTPEPRTSALKYRVDLTYRDGTRSTWTRPYPPKWDFFDRQKSYHFQKWDLATDRLERNETLWIGLVDYLKRLYESPTNPIATVSLVRMSAQWPPPREEGYVMPNDSELRWNDEMVFTYDARTGAYARGSAP